ncbi:MAG: immunogenic protein [Clostridia bacterium]|nr:immunogenic protein [Clostridia bacterium]
MKKVISILLLIAAAVVFAGCKKDSPVRNTVNGNMKTYYEMQNGTWQCDGYTYKYRLEISGRMPNAAADTTFVYLSNIEEIPFEKAYMAGGLSSNFADYFKPDEALLVEMN